MLSLVFMAFLMTPLLMNAQSPIDKVFEKYGSQEGFTSVNISKEMFQSAIVAAGLQSGRSIQILHHMTQGADHPVSLFHPEGAYLKGLILYVS